MKPESDKLREALNLYREGDLTRAEMLLESIDIDDLDPDLHVETNYLWGLVLARRGDALEAAHRFQLCVKQEPRFFPALDAWGNVLANLGDSRGAIEKYKRALAVADGASLVDRPDVELFGPLLQVIRVDDFDQAIAEAEHKTLA